LHLVIVGPNRCGTTILSIRSGNVLNVCGWLGGGLDKEGNHWAAVALCFRWHNFGHVHKLLRVTPAMVAGISDHICSVRELLM